MKITLSYQQRGVAKIDLDKNLSQLRNTFNSNNIDNFIYYLDDDSSKDASYIVQKVKSEIISSDLVVGFIHHDIKSEGQLLELGISEGLGKNILLFVNIEHKDKYYLSYGLEKSETIFYNNIDELLILFDKYLKGK